MEVKYTEITFNSVEDLLAYQRSQKTQKGQDMFTVTSSSPEVRPQIPATRVIEAGRRTPEVTGRNIGWTLGALRAALVGKKITWNHWNNGVYQDKSGIVETVGPCVDGTSGWFGDTSVSVKFRGAGKPIPLYRHELKKAVIEDAVD
jgi:hypothetical protein